MPPHPCPHVHHARIEQEKRKRHEDALLMMQAATASKGTGNSSSSSSISGEDVDDLDPPPPQGGRHGPPRAQPSISVTQRFEVRHSLSTHLVELFTFVVAVSAFFSQSPHRKTFGRYLSTFFFLSGSEVRVLDLSPPSLLFTFWHLPFYFLLLLLFQ